MINIFDFIKLLLNDNKLKNIKFNKEYLFEINYKHDIDYIIYLKNDIKFMINKLNYYNINNLIFIYKLSKINNNNIIINEYYNYIIILKNKIYELCNKHNNKKYYNIIDNITSHIIYNIIFEHIKIFNDKYNYLNDGLYYKIKNKICYYYDILILIINNNNKLDLNNFIKKMINFIKKDIYYINKYENNNYLKILIY